MTRKRDIKQFRQACREAGLNARERSISRSGMRKMGGSWRLATQDAGWSPSDLSAFVGRLIEDAQVEESGELRLGLSGGRLLEVKPAGRGAENDPPGWEVITPAGLVLEFGPGVCWRVHRADG